MNSGDFIGFLGWVTGISFGLAILNFFVKYANKNFISKLGKDKKQLVDLYRKIMKLVIKNHKLVGTIAVVAVSTHFFVAYSAGDIKITGIISALLMLTIFILGIYGSYIKKSNKGIWLKIHRIIAFSLIISIAIHVLL